MQRIIVIGCCGAGKSTLALEVAKRLALPLHHLDRLFWRPNWEESAPEEFRARQEAILGEPSWIIDGNYGSTLHLRLEACDTVIYLDLPLRICLWRVLKRSLFRQTRPDMADGCVERFDLAFYRYVLNFPRDHRPRIEKLLADKTHCTVHRLSSPKEVRAFLSSLSRQAITNNPVTTSHDSRRNRI